MPIKPPTDASNRLVVQVRQDGRRQRVLALSGPLDYYTARLLPDAYRTLLEQEIHTLRRLVLDLRAVNTFDETGIAALVEVVRDADTRRFMFAIADRADRPAYIATGLRYRVRFLTEEQIRELPAR